MSWRQLQTIAETNRQILAEELREPPVYCPNDSTTLDITEAGVYHCPFDGWIWDGRPFPK